MKVTQAIAEILKREGVDLVCGYPVNPLYESCAALDIRTVVVRQERTAAHMADSYSRQNSGNKIGVFICQHGPGVENSFGGVAQAFGESVPILILPMGYLRREMNVYPNFSANTNFQHITKWCEPLNQGKSVTDVMRRAFSQLRNGRPGPVMVEVPMDVFGEDIGETIDYTPSFTTDFVPSPAAIKEAAEVLANADNPVLYAGQGVHYSEAWDELKELAELLSIPVTTSLEGKSAFPENHPLALGSGGRAVSQPLHDFLHEADVIFGVGCSFTRSDYNTQFTKRAYLKNPKTIIHSTLDPKDLNKDTEIQYPLVGDAKLTLRAFIDELKDKPNAKADARKESVPPKIKASKDGWLEIWNKKLHSTENPMTPYRVIHELMNVCDVPNTIITHDAGSPRDQLSPFWEAITPLSYIGWGKTTQLGYGLGLAMGAKLAKPDKLCINVWGDAAIGFTGMDFETAVREKIPILSILFNNFSMAIEIPIMPISQEKYGSTDISGNYADMAKAFGGYGERITDEKDIVAAIKRGIEATQNGQAALLEFCTSKEIEYSFLKHDDK
jgi:acetolactate synthase-1/2/3 large subunit